MTSNPNPWIRWLLVDRDDPKVIDRVANAIYRAQHPHGHLAWRPVDERLKYRTAAQSVLAALGEDA